MAKRDPLKNVALGETPQNEAIPGTVANSAGGFSFPVDDWTRLTRFLILGTEGGTYYISEQKLTMQNAKALENCIKADGVRVVNEIVSISEAGRAARQNPTLFALAAASQFGDDATRSAAYAAVGRVCRTATMLFMFLEYRKTLNGGKLNVGRGLRKALDSWFAREPEKLALQMVKYRQREGWTHGDALRQGHPSDGNNPTRAAAFRFALGRDDYDQDALPEMIKGYLALSTETKAKSAAKLIREYSLPWETVPSNLLNEPEVWKAIFDSNLPLGALIRQLPRLTRLGLVRELNVAGRLTKQDEIERARIHPFNVLNALATYRTGQARSGDGYVPDRVVIDALDEAFYLAFGNVTPTGKRTLLALDVSGSMGCSTILGSNLTCRDGSAAMSMVTARAESDYRVVGFTSGSRWDRYGAGLTELDISPRQRLDDVVKTISRLPFGGTDCALPMVEALKNKWLIDTFVIYTDSETWAGNIHPHQALVKYRRATGIPARLVVVGMASNGFSIADPTDAGEMDVVGFDSAAPELISSFARGDI